MERKEATEQKYKFLIVDDHPVVLHGISSYLQLKYPHAIVLTAETARQARERLECEQFDLVLLDLGIPEKLGDKQQVTTGMSLLKSLMKNFPKMNLVILSSNVDHLVRIKYEIDKHEGGFTVAPKGFSHADLLARVEGALQGFSHTKDIRGIQKGLELRPEWMEVLTLAFREGLKDKIIAKRMNVAERTVRHYWTKIYDVLGIYSEDDKSLRVQTGIRAREEGLIE